jgi:hypothetical protein
MKSLIRLNFVICSLVIITLVNFSFVNDLRNSDRPFNKDLIIGKWVCKNSPFGTVSLVFNKQGSGFGTTDSIKSLYKFKYLITQNGILKLSVGHYKPDLYLIKVLTSTSLSLREYPYKKYRESISAYNNDFVRQ